MYGDHPRYLVNYFQQYKGYYFTGDGCTRDKDGYYWITGRVDGNEQAYFFFSFLKLDVMNVSGHRIGSAEVESVLVSHSKIAEAAVIGIPHDVKGYSDFLKSSVVLTFYLALLYLHMLLLKMVMQSTKRSSK